VTSLAAGDFLLTDGSSPRRIESAKFETGAVDVMLLVDASLAGQMIQEAAGSMVAQLGEKEQMAVVAFHSTPDLIQDFTSSKQRLTAAIGGIRFGNDPRMLDAVFAGADGGFENSTWRRVIVLITAGIEGRSRVSEASVIRVARKNGVSVFPVFALGYERGMFETLARNTGGAVFSMRDLSKATKAPAARIFEVMRGWYSVMVSGNLALTEKFKLEVKQPGRKLLVSALALD
jgi:Mg-chelatase subunit ChlD